MTQDSKPAAEPVAPSVDVATEKRPTTDLFLVSDEEFDPESREFYRQALIIMNTAQIPFMVGGAYSFGTYTGIVRHTKDFDIFIREQDFKRVLEVFAEAGYVTEVTAAHWLGKAFSGDSFVDFIFGAGNGVAMVDDIWFRYAVDAQILGELVKLCPVEETIWSKALIMERERYDGADVAHLLRARADMLDWKRLLWRFAEDWRVLFSHLVLFGFIYPSERGRIPAWVMHTLVGRLQNEVETPPVAEKICRGTLLSRSQYVVDVERWGYEDARVEPSGTMTVTDVESWTDAAEQDGSF